MALSLLVNTLLLATAKNYWLLTAFNQSQDTPDFLRQRFAMRHNSLARLAIYMVLTLLAGCTVHFSPQIKTVSLDFLEYGKITRETVVTKLGPPFGTLEGGQRIFYWLGHSSAGDFVLDQKSVTSDFPHPPRGDYQFRILLTFDEHNLLQKYSLFFRSKRIHLQFLENEKANKEMVLTELGPPFTVLEAETIYSYWLGETKEGYIVLDRAAIAAPPEVPIWRREIEGKFSLVLIFDANGVLHKHSLVPVK
jgi:hypothetical protein